MTTFLVLYRSATSAAERMATIDPDAGAASIEAWMRWATAAGEALVDLGAPTQSLTGADGRSQSHISGYSLMQADDLPTLERLLVEHPHRADGGTIEVLEILAVPGM